MTTVTQAAKHSPPSDDDVLEPGDLDEICEDPALARRVARRILDRVQGTVPEDWSLEDLRDVLDVACHGAHQDQVQVLQGRYFRKRLREQCALAERYGDPFACLVISLAPTTRSTVYDSVLDAITDQLRSSDMVFLYRRRFALILPRMRAVSLESMVERLDKLLRVGAGQEAVRSVARLAYPDPSMPDPRAALDWAEDQLRDI